MMRRIYFVLIVLVLGFATKGQPASNLVQRIDPPSWFQNLGDNQLQLLFYGKDIKKAHVQSLSTNATVLYLDTTLSKDYLICALAIAPNFVGNITLLITQGKRKQQVIYAIDSLHRNPLHINASDVMYMVMPDRFANGDTANDNLLREKVNRTLPKGRHGGDIKGIMNHLNYIKEQGYSSLWINPLIENNQPVESYHGYAATDFYRIDARFGDNASYKQLSLRCKTNGIKMVMDVVYNHCGDRHPFYTHLISPQWFNLFDTFTRSNYRGAAMADPYASEFDKQKMSKGWFDRHMPDMNLQDKNCATYFIQNTLWWIAYAQLSGIRIDTYPYPDLSFMEKLTAAVKKDFPGVFVFGETWEHGEPLQAYFAKNTIANTHTGSLDGVTDFQLYFALNKAFTEPFGWTEGLSRLYYIQAKDFLYQNPNHLVTFVDNHDLDRILGVLQNDIDKLKMALGFLLTSRGIPCIYYGTELLFNEKGDHGLLRKDMPGGWQGDTLNIFVQQGRSEAQQEIFHFIQTLTQYRTQHNLLFEKGKRIQFIPENGTYAYFVKYNHTVLGVFMNQNTTAQHLDLARFSEVMGASFSSFDVLLNKEIILDKSILLQPNGIQVISFEL